MSVSNSEKSILAKLLASENIRIEHQKVATAAFNLRDRALILPIWKEMSADLYDLLIGHEIGHALYTPAEGWHDAIEDGGNGIKSLLNILEDARIERKVKDKYPGIRKNFWRPCGMSRLMAIRIRPWLCSRPAFTIPLTSSTRSSRAPWASRSLRIRISLLRMISFT